jgi:hypothetical protein
MLLDLDNWEKERGTQEHDYEKCDMRNDPTFGHTFLTSHECTALFGT